MIKKISLFLSVSLILLFSACAGENDYPWNTNEEFQGVTFEHLTSVGYAEPLAPTIEGIPEIITFPEPPPAPPVGNEELYTLSGSLDYESIMEHLLEASLKFQKSDSESSLTYTSKLPSESSMQPRCSVCIYLLSDENNIGKLTIDKDICVQLSVSDERENNFKFKHNYPGYIALGIDRCTSPALIGLATLAEKPTFLYLETETGKTTNSFKLIEKNVDFKTIWVEQYYFDNPKVKEANKVLRAENEIFLSDSPKATPGPRVEKDLKEGSTLVEEYKD